MAEKYQSSGSVNIEKVRGRSTAAPTRRYLGLPTVISQNNVMSYTQNPNTTEPYKCNVFRPYYTHGILCYSMKTMAIHPDADRFSASSVGIHIPMF